MPTNPPSFPDTGITTERLLPTDARYPHALHDLRENAPGHLWARGRLECLNAQPMVSIVGTRRATSAGLRVARELGGAFARAGACVVSGMALGIDAAAHRAALENGGTTIAVLGTGLDIVYPRAHRTLQLQIMRQGALLSELEPTVPGFKFNFPKRNRLIAALGAATIVVEAPARSGALGTAAMALELGRDVAAIPGPIEQPACAGSNMLIRDGATILTSIEEALSLIGLTPGLRVPHVDPEGDEGRVWRALAGGPLDIDLLATRCGLPAARCLGAVTTLELSGAIECALTGEIRRR